MPCAGCQRRRKKIVAAITAVKQGIAQVGHSYRMQTAPLQKKDPKRAIPPQTIDIRQ